MKSIAILGSTGSIGVSTLDVVRQHPEQFSVAGLAAGGNIALLAEQIREFSPRVVSVRDPAAAETLRSSLGSKCPEILSGVEGAAAVAAVDEAELVISAIVGAAGLVPTVTAIRAGKHIGLANKETLVVAGRLVSDLAREYNVQIIPVDSEHSAIYQSLAGHRHEDVLRVILTASGGPFLNTPAEDIARVTPAQALKHPRWTMGSKITIDSATLMNKGLEVIEAHWLFDMPAEKIGVVVHPQSIVHSMVEYIDGCVMAQLGVPDMRAPIAYAMAWPERCPSGIDRLNLAGIGTLTFLEPDTDRFPSLRLAYDALKGGNTYPAVLNAANEIAVAAFLDNRLAFNGIPELVERTMQAHEAWTPTELDEYLEADRWARCTAESLIA